MIRHCGLWRLRFTINLLGEEISEPKTIFSTRLSHPTIDYGMVTFDYVRPVLLSTTRLARGWCFAGKRLSTGLLSGSRSTLHLQRRPSHRDPGCQLRVNLAPKIATGKVIVVGKVVALEGGRPVTMKD